MDLETARAILAEAAPHDLAAPAREALDVVFAALADAGLLHAARALRAGDQVTVIDGSLRYAGEVKNLGNAGGPLVVALAPTCEDDVLPTTVTIGGKGHGRQTFEQECPGGC